jgi:exopolysaccharide biosynthesis polyprenyl glycosylphosphotransferase
MGRTNSLIYIYCAETYVDTVKSSLENSDITISVNDYSIKDTESKTICHYRSAELDFKSRSFLINAIEQGSHVEPLVAYLEKKYGYTEINLLHSGYFLHQKSFSILSNTKSQTGKRILDILAALILSVIAIPICIISAILIKLDSKGPLFYKQKRVGLFNKEYEVIKFRSMTTDAEKGGAQWAAKNDARVTRMGKFIRKTRIDELPQLMNVFKGDMSIVGPRPEREVFIQELEKEIPYYRFRHALKPGITGLAQVKYAYGASIEDAEWKHRYDIHYIKHRNIWLDIKILCLTIKTVLFGMGQ